jgi:hypothetical protein
VLQQVIQAPESEVLYLARVDVVEQAVYREITPVQSAPQDQTECGII